VALAPKAQQLQRARVMARRTMAGSPTDSSCSMKDSANGLRTRLSNDLASVFGVIPRVALITGISPCQFEI